MPLVVAKNPLVQCMAPAATIMTESIRAGPTEPSKPNVISRPATISVSTAIAANTRPGPEAKQLEEPTRGGQAIAAEPAEELRRSMGA